MDGFDNGKQVSHRHLSTGLSFMSWIVILRRVLPTDNVGGSSSYSSTLQGCPVMMSSSMRQGNAPGASLLLYSQGIGFS